MFYLTIPLVLLLSFVAQAVIIPPIVEPGIAALVLAYEANPARRVLGGARQPSARYLRLPNVWACSADGLALWKEFEQINMDPASGYTEQPFTQTPTGLDPWLSQKVKIDLVDIGVDLSRLIMWSVSSISSELRLG